MIPDEQPSFHTYAPCRMLGCKYLIPLVGIGDKTAPTPTPACCCILYAVLLFLFFILPETTYLQLNCLYASFIYNIDLTFIYNVSFV